MSELLHTLTSGIFWLSALATVVAGIVAFAKLKVTPSGLLLGSGLGGVGCANLTSRAVHLAVLSDDEGLAVDSFEALMGVSSCVNLLDGVFWVLIGVGLVLLPASLKTLAERDADAPVQF